MSILDCKTNRDLEQLKFVATDADEVAVRTLGEGDFNLVGFSNVFKVTTIDITDTAQKIPGTADTSRQFMSIRNLDSVESIYVGQDNTVASGQGLGTTAGWDINALENFNVSIASGKELWAVAPAGKTVRIKVLELG